MALSTAERQRRYIERLKARAAETDIAVAADEHVQHLKACADSLIRERTQLECENARLKENIVGLMKENARLAFENERLRSRT
jgi:regulator of replication initiation timing